MSKSLVFQQKEVGFVKYILYGALLGVTLAGTHYQPEISGKRPAHVLRKRCAIPATVRVGALIFNA